MIDSRELKNQIKPTMVAQYYLGQAQKTSGRSLIYKSPFRNERTASFWVSNEKGIHDFGTGMHYDILSFTQELFKIDFKTTLDKLCYDFRIINYKPISKELNTYLLQRRNDEVEIRRNIDSWFNRTLIRLCDKLHEWKKVKPYVYKDALAIAYKQEQNLEYLIDIFINATEEEKIELWKDKKKIEKAGE